MQPNAGIFAVSAITSPSGLKKFRSKARVKKWVFAGLGFFFDNFDNVSPKIEVREYRHDGDTGPPKIAFWGLYPILMYNYLRPQTVKNYKQNVSETTKTHFLTLALPRNFLTPRAKVRGK